ncbi:MAG: FecR family protein [Methylococcaceae bacterium]|jgi:transmembrane sensor
MAYLIQETPTDDASDAAVAWLVRLRAGELTEAETHEFADWLSASVEHVDAFANAERCFNEMVLAEQVPQSSVLAQNPPRTTSHPKVTGLPRRSMKAWLAIPLFLAAAWMLAVAMVLPNQSSLLDALLSDYHTQTGQLQEVKLADGSHLLLNTNTAISVVFDSQTRVITLHHGQIKVNVAEDSLRPFVVKVGNLEVKALGTVFEVYQKDTGDISVTVQEHAVNVRRPLENNIAEDELPAQFTVQAGQQWLYQNSAGLKPPFEVNLAQATAWQYHNLSVKDRPLSELIDELNRYRLGRIYLVGEALKNLKVSGVFPMDNPDDVLASIQKVLALKQTRVGPWWVLLHQ